MLESLTTTQVVQYHKIDPKDTQITVQLGSGRQLQPIAQLATPKESPTTAQSSPVDSNHKKRKRDASPSSIVDKRARHSAATSADMKRTAASQNDRPSPTPRSVPSTSSVPSRSVNRWDSIARPCAASTTTELTDYVSSYDIVKGNLNNFKVCSFGLSHTHYAGFLNKRDPFDQSFNPEYMPYVDLEYPMTGLSERFALLSPKDDDAWHPIKELIEVVYVIVRFYLPQEFAARLGDPDYTDAIRQGSGNKLGRTMLPTPSVTPEGGSSPAPSLRPAKPVSPHVGNLLRQMERAYTSRDGIAFKCAINEINRELRALKDNKECNSLLRSPAEWDGMRPEMVIHIYEETYQRSAGPRVKELVKYQAFSSTTYGELNGGLIAEMTHRAGLKPGVNFLDLGSGIGNVVIQTALLSGCTSSGVEKLKQTADIADEVHRVFRQRCRLWGVEPGPSEVFQGDFMQHTDKLQTIIKDADVILANNFVFDPALNEGLKALFLDLKDGAKIISLRSFCDGQVTARNMGAIESILDVESFEWRSGDVSWGDAAGRYYISTVNRARMGAQYEAMYKEAQAPARASRRRR